MRNGRDITKGRHEESKKHERKAEVNGLIVYGRRNRLMYSSAHEQGFRKTWLDEQDVRASKRSHR